MENYIEEICKSIKKKELVLFCGAGISKNSGLPLSNELKLYILDKLFIDKNINSEKDIKKIMKSNLPFETFMEIISENNGISDILDMFSSGEPNTNHIMISKLAKKVRTIVTTNFDLLIEEALENEGLVRDKDFKVYYNEKQFSEVDFNADDETIRIIKIHGSVEEKESIRTTMKMIASATLSNKRRSIIRYLFSKGSHEKVLIFGYSCSDNFDIIPQIQDIEENQKEVIIVDHSKKEKVEDIKTEGFGNPFKKFPGIRIMCNTDMFIENLWKSLEEIVGIYESKKFEVKWKTYIDRWAKSLDKGKGCEFFMISSIFHNISDFKSAIEYLSKCLGIIKSRTGAAKCYTNLGTAYHSLGDFRKAIEYHEKSLVISKNIGDEAVESKCYTSLGTAYHSLGDFRKAIEYYIKSLEISKETGMRAEESKCYTGLGAAHYSLGDSKKAIEYYQKSLKIVKETGDIDLERIICLNISRIYYDSKPELSYGYCKRSIEISELISRNLVEEQHKLTFCTRASDAYQLMVPLCINLKKETEAFNYTERAKSRVLLDLLPVTDIKSTEQLTGELELLLNEEKRFLYKLREIQMRHLRQTKTLVEPGEVEQIYNKLSQVYNAIEKYDPEYVFTRRGKPLSLNEIQYMLSLQKRAVVLIDYFMSEDKVFIFVVSSKESELHIETVPLSAKTLEQYIENYPKKMAVYSYFQHIDKTLLELGKYLIDPVSDYLAKGDLIYFVPYGPLHYIPLHAVELRGEPLIKRHPIVYAPSASIIKFCQKKGSNKLKNCASFGVDPYGNIKDTVEKEAEKVAGLFNGTSYTDCQATKSTVLKNCIDKDIIHFACHGTFDNADPLSSGVVLHNKVILSAREIFDMRLTTELVTLSACQTGVNERNPGDELIGLTRAFLYVGAPSVIVSLWSVDSPSTYELMLAFYKQLKKGADKATALQQAQIKIMEKKEYTHPYYWAPFVLVGDWQ